MRLVKIHMTEVSKTTSQISADCAKKSQEYKKKLSALMSKTSKTAADNKRIETIKGYIKDLDGRVSDMKTHVDVNKKGADKRLSISANDEVPSKKNSVIKLLTDKQFSDAMFSLYVNWKDSDQNDDLHKYVQVMRNELEGTDFKFETTVVRPNFGCIVNYKGLRLMLSVRSKGGQLIMSADQVK